jgi:hypothetical protein
MAKAKSKFYLVALALGMLLAPLGAEARQANTTPTTPEAQQIVARMAADPRYPMFQTLRLDMAKLLESGAANNLDQAYRIAKENMRQSMIGVLSSPNSNSTERWVAAHELLYDLH